MAKSKSKAEYGDFQTPDVLAKQVCALLQRRGVRPASLIEPTCGLGALLFGALDQFAVQLAIGADVNPTYIKWAQRTLEDRASGNSARLATADFFATDWNAVVADLPEPILVIGNPPWVTNSHLATLGSQNLPVKSNFQKQAGFDAITGKANFDISEWMQIQLLGALNGRRGTLAMLCKSSVARKCLLHAWKQRLAIRQAAIYGIDAVAHFDASVDAVLLVIDFEPGAVASEAAVYHDLKTGEPLSEIGYDDGLLLADIHAYQQWKHLSGTSPLQWRSGIKHDCSKVMELRREGRKYRNGLGELVELEDTYLSRCSKALIWPMAAATINAAGLSFLKKQLATRRARSSSRLQRRGHTWARMPIFSISEVAPSIATDRRIQFLALAIIASRRGKWRSAGSING